jgi:hypothetical protein
MAIFSNRSLNEKENRNYTLIILRDWVFNIVLKMMKQS